PLLGRSGLTAEDHLAPSTKTLTVRTASVPSTWFALLATSSARNRTWTAHAADDARTRRTGPSIRNGTHSAASRSPTTSAHRRASRPSDSPELRGRRSTSWSRMTAMGSAWSVLSPGSPREPPREPPAGLLDRSGRPDMAFLHAPDV